MYPKESPYERFVIKSFKHDGSLHRVWMENWQVPAQLLHTEHAEESVWVYLNEQTTIIEKGGKEWVSKIPAVSFFLPNEWFNVVALLEDKGIRYYCNLASPPYRYGDVLTYIDYDLDLVVLPDGSIHELDRDEFVRHKAEYRYSESVLDQIEFGLRKLREAIRSQSLPFGDEIAYRYYEQWKKQMNAEGESTQP
jgi:protein associated with RNAse G/E